MSPDLRTLYDGCSPSESTALSTLPMGVQTTILNALAKAYDQGWNRGYQQGWESGWHGGHDDLEYGTPMKTNETKI